MVCLNYSSSVLTASLPSSFALSGLAPVVKSRSTRTVSSIFVFFKFTPRPFIAANVTERSKLQHDGVPYHQCPICLGSSNGSWWLGHQEWGTYAVQVLVKI